MTNGNGKHDRGPLRRLLEVIEAPLPRERAGLMPGGRIVITDDGRGLARRLESQLLAAGVPVERIGGPEANHRLDVAGGHRRGARPTAIARSAGWNRARASHGRQVPRSNESKPTGQPASASR